MHVLHGTWIPDDDAGFVQAGRFVLWAEAAQPSRAGLKVITLPPQELAGLLAAEAGLGRDPAAVRRGLSVCHLLLPEQDGKLLPSPELARAADLPSPDPEAPVTLVSREASCHLLHDVAATLKDLHFIAEYRLADLRLGSDLRFWHAACRVLAQVLRKDQYIPALKYQPLPNTGRKKLPDFAIHPGWEIVSEAYEKAIRPLAAAMPRLCGAGARQAHGSTALYEPQTLLRHFCECQLAAQIHRARLPAAFMKRIANTLLDDCLGQHSSKSSGAQGDRALDRYRQWRRWRRALAGGGDGGGFQLCFQLLEAETESDSWYVQFRVASRADPSLRPALADYWADPAIRALVARQFGADFERQALTQLGYAARMVPRLWDGLDSERPAGVALTLEEAFDFLREHAWVLQDAGFMVLVPAWWTPQGRQRARLRLRASGGKTAAAASGYFSLDALVQYRYELAIGGEAVSADEWRQLVAAKTPLVRFRGQWLALDKEQMQRMLAFWNAHQDRDATMTLAELLHKAAAGEDEVDVAHDAALAAMLEALRDPARLQPLDDPPALHGRLRDYQKRGVAWLAFLETLGLGGCLADDMGLGKTVQVIARLLHAGPEEPPTLLIAPTSVLGNWQRETARFAPGLAVLLHHGGDRLDDPRSFRDACAGKALVITSYALARRDAKLLQAVAWRRVVLDEAQNIKNPAAAQTKAILKLDSRQRLALTGTPVENRLLDLWSIFNFLNPGFLGSQGQFRKTFERPVQRDRDPEKTAVLKRLVQPFILRRLKTDKAIIADLPDKVENRQFCNLTREQASLYEAVVKEVERELEEAQGMQRRGLILATLMRLKQICNHPMQFLQDNSPFTPERSHKLARLLEMLDEAIQEGESLLVFTQFTEIGAALEKRLRADYRTYYLHGGTPRARRERMIGEFQDGDGEPAVFVLSLKAGGTGITLTRANHVFHFDRWWNPAVEDQATDRAYRIGQSRSVFVHKFVTLGTLEERIDQMIEDKKAIAGSIVGSDESWLTELSNERFKALIRLNRSAVLE
ncbi:MAG: DEAD/DEAH box helicase [Pseudomonadota bacterium]|nr:DEAD/DEAH box helicase [Pseudomonadota bacterium]